eukprot:3850793-Prymnesium_polylepis.2
MPPHCCSPPRLRWLTCSTSAFVRRHAWPGPSSWPRLIRGHSSTAGEASRTVSAMEKPTLLSTVEDGDGVASGEPPRDRHGQRLPGALRLRDVLEDATDQDGHDTAHGGDEEEEVQPLRGMPVAWENPHIYGRADSSGHAHPRLGDADH